MEQEYGEDIEQIEELKFSELNRIIGKNIKEIEKEKKQLQKQKMKIEKAWRKRKKEEERRKTREKYNLTLEQYDEILDLATFSRNGNTTGLSSSIYDFDRKKKIYLVCTRGWAEYSRSFGNRYREFYTIVGWDKDNKRFFATPIGKVDTLAEALEWIKPAAVKKAEAEKKKVTRQGDMFIVERKRYGRTHNGRHVYDEVNKQVIHPEHAPVKVDYPFTIIPVKSTEGIGGRD
jgi:hypothetical protein